MVSNPQPEPVDVPHKVGLRTFPIKLHELLFFICMPTRDAKQFWKKNSFNIETGVAIRVRNRDFVMFWNRKVVNIYNYN